MLGGFLALLAAATFGLNAVATRRGVLTGTVAQGLAITVPIAVPIFFVVGLTTDSLGILSELPIKSLLLLGIAGVTHFIVGRYANYRATKAMGANLVGPVVSSSLVLTLILAIIFLDEVMTPLRVLGIVLIALGPTLMLRSPAIARKTQQSVTKMAFTPRLIEGYAFGIICAIAFGTTPIFIRSAFLELGEANVGHGIVGGLLSYVVATALLGLYLLKPGNLRHALSIDRNAGKWFLLTGLFVCVSQMLRFMALAIAPVSVVTPIIQTSGIFRTIFGWFINRKHEVFDAWVLLGVAVTIVGTTTLTISTETVITVIDPPQYISEFLRWHWP